MAEEGGYNIGNIYQGGYSSLSPNYGSFVGHRSAAGDVGLNIDARSANVAKEISEKINVGGTTFEVTQVFPEVFDSIPNDQLKEVNRITKLTGVDVSLHAPIVGIDPSGMDKQGNFSETTREGNERQMINAVMRGQDLKPEGGMPITFHAAEGIPEAYPEKGDKESKETWVVDTEKKSIVRLPLKERAFPGEQEASVERELQTINEAQWRQSLSHLAYNTERASQIIESSAHHAKLAETQLKQGKEISTVGKKIMSQFNVGTAFLNDSYRELKEFYNLAYKNGTPQEKRLLDELNKKIENKVEMINKEPNSNESILLRKEIVEEGFETLQKIAPPEIYKPLEDYALEKSSQTFGNVAFEAYKKFKDKAPIISIENSYAGGAFSTGEGLKKVIDASKENFVKVAMKEGVSKTVARRAADKILGATWDVGRLNTLRKQGFTEEELIKQSETIAPLVKHVHLSDNFGYESTELPMGMGNVPIKEIMGKLGQKGFKGKKIIEALNWWQHFSPKGSPQVSPLVPTLEAFGAPIYSSGEGAYWNQTVGLQQGYMGGYGMMLPSKHYETFGAGFSQLPAELGGSVQQGGGGRMSGTPME